VWVCGCVGVYVCGWRQIDHLFCSGYQPVRQYESRTHHERDVGRGDDDARRVRDADSAAVLAGEEGAVEDALSLGEQKGEALARRLARLHPVQRRAVGRGPVLDAHSALARIASAEGRQRDVQRRAVAGEGLGAEGRDGRGGVVTIDGREEGDALNVEHVHVQHDFPTRGLQPLHRQRGGPLHAAHLEIDLGGQSICVLVPVGDVETEKGSQARAC